MRLKSHFFLGVLLAITGGACSSGQHDYGKPKKHIQEKVTADDQMKGNDSDIEVTRKIRSRLNDDDALSLSAQNITIVTLKKSVTLKGEVRNEKEKERVLEHARTSLSY
jgi:osmotically-inducible protein OsmY